MHTHVYDSNYRKEKRKTVISFYSQRLNTQTQSHFYGTPHTHTYTPQKDAVIAVFLLASTEQKTNLSIYVWYLREW